MNSTNPATQTTNGMDTTLNGTNASNKVSHGEMRSTMEQGMGSLRADLSTLKSDLDGLMSRISTMSETDLREAYDKAMIRFDAMCDSAKELATQAEEQFNQGVEATTEYVREKPLQAVGIAAGIGLLLGMLMTRR